MIGPVWPDDLPALLDDRDVLIVRSADTQLFFKSVDMLLSGAPRARVSLLVPPWLRASGLLDRYDALRRVFVAGYDPWDRLSRSRVSRLQFLKEQRFDVVVLQFEHPLGIGLRGEDRLARALAPRTLILNSRGRLLLVDASGFRSLAWRRLLATTVMPAALALFGALMLLPALVCSWTGLYDPLRPLRLKK